MDAPTERLAVEREVEIAAAPETWKNVKAHAEFVPIAAMSPASTTATMGRPRSGTIDAGITDAGGAAAAAGAAVTAAIARPYNRGQPTFHR